MLADAGVELGVTYPYPVVSLAESEKHLKIAAKVIQETLAASMAASQVQLLLRNLSSLLQIVNSAGCMQGFRYGHGANSASNLNQA